MFRTLINKAIVTIGLSSLLIVSYSHVALADRTKGGKEGLPGSRIGGGTRGECYLRKPLVALVPENNLVLTKSAYPKFFFYLPPTATPKQIEFVLQDEDNNEIYQTMFTSNGSAGVMNVSLPEKESIPPLAFGKDYRWQLVIICNSEKREHDVGVNGWVKRVKLDFAQTKKLEQAKPREQINIYTSSGLWQDALLKLAELRYEQPNDMRLSNDWSELLSSLGLDAIAQEPLINIERQAASPISMK